MWSSNFGGLFPFLYFAPYGKRGILSIHVLIDEVVLRITIQKKNAVLRIAKWVVLQMEFENFSVNVINHNWEACIVTGIFKEKVVVLWSPPIKFNVNGTVKGKQGLASIGNVLHNTKRGVLFMFSTFVSLKNSNETEVLAILKVLRICSCFFHNRMIVESDSANALSWITFMERGLWKLYFYFNENKFLSSMVLNISKVQVNSA